MSDSPSDPFQREITALWAALGLPPPTFGTSSEIVLSVDGLDLTLREGADGRHLLVSGFGGALSENEIEAGRQIERILMASLASLTSNPTCVTLAGAGIDKREVQCLARHPYGRYGAGALMARIESVLTMVEYWRGELRTRAPATPKAKAPEPFDSALIFRP